MSRKHTHAYATFQRGKGLVGFLAGLVLATMIIIAVLLMLNSNSKRDFRQLPPTASEPTTTQTLTPHGNASDANIASTVQQPEVIDDSTRTQPQVPPTVEPINQTDNGDNTTNTGTNEQTQTTPSSETPDDANNTTTPAEPVEPSKQPADDKEMTNRPIKDIPPIDDTPVVRPVRPHNPSGSSHINKPRPTVSPKQQDDVYVPEIDTPRRPTRPVTPSTPTRPSRPAVVEPTTPTRPVRPAEPVVTPSKPKPAVTPSKPKDTTTTAPVRKPTPVTPPKKDVDVKPTPQQILDSGNIEKAREMARKQADNKKAAKTAVATSTAPSHTTTKRNTNSAVVIQAGAYGSRNAAEQQRARLALLGVQTKIVEANVNGKSTFRVQTNRMEGSQATSARTVLHKNGVSTLERNAE